MPQTWTKLASANGPLGGRGAAPRAAARPAGPEAGVHRILRNSTLNLIGQGLLAVTHLAVVFILARALGKGGLGEYYTFFALIHIVQLILEAGINTILTCRIAQRPEAWRGVVAEGTALFAVISIASAGLFFAAGAAWAWLADSVSIWHYCLAAGVACAAIQVQRFTTAVFRAFEQFGWENVGRVFQGTLFLGLVFALVLGDAVGVATVLGAFAVSHVAAGLAMVAALQRRWHCLGWRLNGAVVRDWLREAIPLGFGDVVRRLTWQLDTVLLGLMQPAAVVGVYSVAYRPLGPLNWLPQAVLTAMFPSLARLAEEDRPGLARAFAHSVRIMWIVSLPLAVAICLTAEPLITILAGPEFLEAVVPMRLLIWVAILSFLSMQFRFVFTAVGQQRLLARLAVAVFVLEFAIELALIPRWGFLGACAGTLVGELIFAVVGLWFCRRLGFGSIDWGAIAGATVAAAVMAVPIWLAEGQPLAILAVVVAASTGLYFVLTMCLGALPVSEVRRLVEACCGRFRVSCVEVSK